MDIDMKKMFENINADKLIIVTGEKGMGMSEYQINMSEYKNISKHIDLTASEHKEIKEWMSEYLYRGKAVSKSIYDKLKDVFPEEIQ